MLAAPVSFDGGRLGGRGTDGERDRGQGRVGDRVFFGSVFFEFCGSRQLLTETVGGVHAATVAVCTAALTYCASAWCRNPMVSRQRTLLNRQWCAVLHYALPLSLCGFYVSSLFLCLYVCVAHVHRQCHAELLQCI